ncbi:MAG: hypothetical protein ABW086_08615 [Sedimenticola sp.]
MSERTDLSPTLTELVHLLAEVAVDELIADELDPEEGEVDAEF